MVVRANELEEGGRLSSEHASEEWECVCAGNLSCLHRGHAWNLGFIRAQREEARGG